MQTGEHPKVFRAFVTAREHEGYGRKFLSDAKNSGAEKGIMSRRTLSVRTSFPSEYSASPRMRFTSFLT